MVEVIDLDISISGFRILPIQKSFDLTTGKTRYHSEPNDGGIRIKPRLHYDDIEIGYFYITQVCRSHHISILGNSGNIYEFNTNSKEYKDTHLRPAKHFAIYKIINNETYDFAGRRTTEVIFIDTPYKELFSYWNEIIYKIEFETWFQYSESDDVDKDVKPLLSLKWNLFGRAISNENKWTLLNESHSSQENIYDSIIWKNKNDSPKTTSTLPHLKTAVHDCFKKFPETRTDYIK